ncbi:HIT family protein [Candidatus Pelagibacter sp.]|nr:HIT family protein [Candidatus Pelagibacter sp.]
MPFKINKKFLKSSHHIAELKLCSIRLHDNSKFPWVILIPKRNKITDMSDLSLKDQILLMKEIVHVSKIMKKLFKTSKLNIEKIGNIVPQLHIHIIARNKKDSSWPLSVWVAKSKSYSKLALTFMIDKLRKAQKKKR